MGNRLELQSIPRRIISIVPSQSELLWDLGLREELAGITKFCIHPREMFRSVTRVGGTKKLHIEKINSLHPDLVIGNKEENDQGQVEELQRKHKVWMSDIQTLEDALAMIAELSRITGKEKNAAGIISRIRGEFESLEKKNYGSALYLIWKNPYMAAGKNTFIDDMLNRAGFTNAVNAERYPEFDENIIRELQPDFILLSSEPYPFSEKHISELKKVCPRSEIMLVDGEMFSWYGSRLLYAPAYFKKLKSQFPSYREYNG